MIVMPGNWSKSTVHYWAGCYKGALGHLYSPGSQRGPYPHLPYALDNGRFSCWAKGVEWNEAAYIALLEWAFMAGRDGQRPTWALVPDLVGDRNGSRLHPERLRRGDNHPSRTRPERRPKGDGHWTKKATGRCATRRGAWRGQTHREGCRGDTSACGKRRGEEGGRESIWHHWNDGLCDRK